MRDRAQLVINCGLIVAGFATGIAFERTLSHWSRDQALAAMAAQLEASEETKYRQALFVQRCSEEWAAIRGGKR